MAPTAVLFGMAHLYMGLGAVVAGTLLGLMLGAIVVRHDSVWDAVIAHAWFDAASFAGLAWLARHHSALLGR